MESSLVHVIHAVFFLLMDMFVFGRALAKSKNSASQKTFSRFALVVVVLQLAAMGAILFENGFFGEFRSIGYLFYYLLAVLPSIVSCLILVWVIRLFSLNGGHFPKWLKVCAIVPIVLFAVVSVFSFKNQWVIYLDENYAMRRGDFYFLQILVSYSYAVAMIILLIREKIKRADNFNTKAVVAVLLYMVPPVIGSYLQIFVDARGYFTVLGISVAMIFVYVGMYMGDEEEHRRLKDLAEFNEKLQLVNKQLRATMMRGELQAKTVAETIRGGFKISKVDRLFTFKYVSEQLAQMLGYTVPEMIEISGGNMAGLVDRDEVRNQLPAAFASVSEGNLFTLNYKVRCKDGSWKHVEERGRVIRIEDAEDEIWSVTVDKDEIVQVETALAKEEKSRKELAEYSDIISNAGLGVWFVTLKDGQRGKMHGNSKLYELMGIDGESMTQEDVHDFLAGRILPEDLPIFGAAIEKMKAGQFAEALYRWKHPTKGYIYNRCGGTAVQLPDGSYQLSGYHGDATEIVMNECKQQELLKEALVAAEESSRAKTAFLNNMSHDIRTPMNAILGFATLMEKECDDPEKLKGHLKKLKNSGDFLLSLINNVLEMARIESGKMEVNERPTRLRDNTDTTMNIFEASLKDRNLTLTASMSIEHDCVYADLVKIREVIVNLVGNAIKYSKVGGKIETSMREIPCSREGYAAYEFVVEDDGIGMSKEFLPHIFDAFVRERNSTESKIVGTGLGMPIVKRLVELMGGTIQVESTEGVGTRFCFTLEHRICTAEEYRSETGSDVADLGKLQGKRILLAEDNDLNAEIAMTLLVEAGFSVERAVDGRVCLSMLTEKDAGYYDFILMDIQMPNLDGYDATREIRQLDDDRKDIPIVAMTANAFEEDRRKAVSLGMNAHVAKPINMDVLLSTLAGLMK
ncbi:MULTISPECIES: ATP-binding protein [unclassified Fibrobacter]|uniref:ATP-binding protein n=1 Tax=unclassified Fibrobacter TaxID=2634177 RepID=UPI000D6D91ED|nr:MULTISPECIES: ATP-binding protein [unclassified Fibrobacter]PWJ59145.1 PAS domain-containing protein [Fibrobacter sp. UWR4]PZW63699.1 PAS domain-containing protein [Fibrobacter sp. UWR1]